MRVKAEGVIMANQTLILNVSDEMNLDNVEQDF